MKEIDNRLVEWAVKETETHYKDEVSILLEHNTYCLEEDRNVRYVNTIISDSKKRIGLSRTFIINGIGYDFNQVSWESFERDADVKGYYVTVLAEANILYSKNEAEKQRFLYLRAKFFANLENSQYMFERGLEWINNAMEVYKTLLFEDELSKVRKGAAFIIDCLAMAVACYNQTYFKSFTKLKELSTMKHLPSNFIQQYKQVVNGKTATELQSLSYNIIKATRDFFKINDKRHGENKITPNYQSLADWYQECSYYFKRIYHFCANNESELAFSASCAIQTDLDDIAKDFKIPNLDIISNFDSNNLSDFAKEVKLAEESIVAAIKSSNVEIDSYSSVDEFINQNS
ncbi:hypothetical protein IAI10_21190 [Clostridium sp. 19966]|uniref:hypothetical protein n=1 Tax=Clostridium sp. 19966 TaxID=2768166 RepID=UPI0028E099BB|nr:hypothetical protein [Clostridium sp. 19966]MDT8719170.1 hypothetical protein [Clostridium sp. 19966]